MTPEDENRIGLRREAHAINDTLLDLFDRLEEAGDLQDAAQAVVRARVALFEAWTYLCTPPEEEDDDD